MRFNSKSISVAGAVTLLLAIATAITLASCMDNDYKFTMDGQEVTVWGAKRTCDTMKSSLLDGDEYSEKPEVMLKQLKAQAEETSDIKTQKEYYQRFYAKRLVSFAELKSQDACGDIVVSEIIQFLSMCGDEKKFKRYADFVNRYAPDKFAYCARKIIHDFEQKPNKRLEHLLKSLARNEFFSAVLGADGESLTHEQMYEQVKKVNIDENWFKTEENQISGLRSTLFNLKICVMRNVNIVNVARGIKAISEEELTPKFRLTNEYFRLAAQMESWDAYNSIKKNFRRQIDSKYSFTVDGHKTIVWEETPLGGFDSCELPDGDNYSREPAEMLKELKARLGQIDKTDQKGYNQFYYTGRLLSYAKVNEEDACRDIEVQEFLKFISLGGRYKRYADFVKHYAPGKFAPCARKIIEDLEGHFGERFESQLKELNKFSRAALGIEDEFQTDQEMYYHISEVDLAEVRFNVRAMIKLLDPERGPCSDYELSKWWATEISNLETVLFHFKVRVRRQVNIVNLALAIGAIEEQELTPKFRLTNEYVHFAAQIADSSVYRSIVQNFKG